MVERSVNTETSALSEAQIAELEKLIDYRFNDRQLLQRSLTHTSVKGSDVNTTAHYERLEFLGDRVLGLVISEKLWRNFPNAKEGELSLRLNALVNGAICAEIADEIGLHKFIRTGADVRQITSKRMASVRADVLEALMAALYLDGGLEIVEKFVSRFWKDRIFKAHAARRDPKTALQEWAHARKQGTPKYEVLERSGPDHDPVFVVQVALESFQGSSGKGRSKRAAEQAAAEATLIEQGVWQGKLT